MTRQAPSPSPSASGGTSIDDILRRRQIIITCGTGGVGKTTLSAAMAIRAATLGRRAVVITIDPAKRLVTSLGLKELGDRPTDITSLLQDVSRRINGKEISGTLAAIMPDTRRTFEAFVRELAPNPAIADRVMRNPIFQIFAKEFSGTNEYMALERLHALYRGKTPGEDFDCIILDTPPSRDTLAFLDAPKLLAQFFDEKIIRWLVLPANKLLAAGMRKALGVLEKLTGAGFMTNLLEFASSLFEVRANFTANLKEITALLESDAVGFVMVTAPSPDLGPESEHFVESVRKHNFKFDGLFINRTLTSVGAANESDAGTGPDAAGLRDALALVRALQERERRVIEKACGAQPDATVCAQLPELARDVHSVEDLFHVAMALGRPDGSAAH